MYFLTFSLNHVSVMDSKLTSALAVFNILNPGLIALKSHLSSLKSKTFNINFDLLIGAAIVHDLSKLGTYTDQNNVFDMSLEGLLTDHYDW